MFSTKLHDSTLQNTPVKMATITKLHLRLPKYPECFISDRPVHHSCIWTSSPTCCDGTRQCNVDCHSCHPSQPQGREYRLWDLSPGEETSNLTQRTQCPICFQQKETDFLKSCPTAQGRHLVVRLFFAKRLSSNWTTCFQNRHKDKVLWTWWATDWVGQLCQRGQRACGHHGPLQGRAL